MYPPIVCVCGNSLGDVYDEYEARKVEEVLKFYDSLGVDYIDPTYMHLARDGVMMGKVLDELHITTECCRSRLLTNVLISEM